MSLFGNREAVGVYKWLHLRVVPQLQKMTWKNIEERKEDRMRSYLSLSFLEQCGLPFLLFNGFWLRLDVKSVWRLVLCTEVRPWYKSFCKDAPSYFTNFLYFTPCLGCYG